MQRRAPMDLQEARIFLDPKAKNRASQQLENGKKAIFWSSKIKTKHG